MNLPGSGCGGASLGCVGAGAGAGSGAAAAGAAAAAFFPLLLLSFLAVFFSLDEKQAKQLIAAIY